MKYVIVVLALCAGIAGWSQQLTFVFKGAVENSDLGKNEAGVTVSIVQGGSTLFSATTVSSGKYSLSGQVDYAQPFDVVFGKPGMVSKRINFDLSKMNLEDIPPGDFRPVESLDISLFKERPNVDFSFLNTEPVASFDWNTRQMNVRLDAVESEAMRKKINDLLNQGEQNEAKYAAAIAAADKLYNEKSYEPARSRYEEALSYKPTDKYASDRIIELDALIQAQKKEDLVQAQQDEEYNNLISAADNLRNQDKLESALSKYKEALTKKDEQYPKDQIEAISKTIEQRKKEAENAAKYDEAIKAADGFLKQNSLLAARDKYTEASKLKPSEQYPKDRLSEIEGKLKAQEEKEAIKKKYEEAVAAADKLFTAEEYEGAKAKYEEALGYEPSSTYAKGRVGMCDEKLAASRAEKERLEKIKQLLAEGNTQFGKEEWEAAKTSFNEVLKLEAGHPEATQKLALIDQKMKDAADKAAQEKQYAQLMKEGGDADVAGKLQDALGKYEAAKAIKSTPEVDTKIADVKKRLADQNAVAEKEAQYSKYMAEGESFLGVLGDVTAARTEFEKASALFPDRKEPKDKIAQIDALLASQKEAQQKKEAYEAAIKQADALFAGEKYEDARKKYQEAAAVDKAQTYPADQIVAIDKKIGEIAAENDRKTKYDAAVKEADALFSGSKYEDARKKYQEAAAIDKAQTYPADQIAAIDKKLGEIAADNDRKAKYDAAVKEADKLLGESKLKDARTKYQEALTFQDNTYPKDKIAEIDTQLAKQAEQDAKNTQIANLLKEGNQLYGAKNLEDARSRFQEVLTLDAANKDADQMIRKINDELAAQKSAAEKDALFTQLKQEGFTLAENKSYDQAKQKLNEALSLKTDKEVSDKIAEIDRLIADQAKQAEKEQAYNTAVKDADRLFADGKWEDAKAKYQQALTQIDQQYPKDKIAEIDTLLANRAEQNAKNAGIAALLQEGNQLYGSKNLDGAKTKFQEVLKLDPANKEADQMIRKINDELAAQKSAAEKEAQFAQLKQEGFSLANNKSYEQAKQKLNEALSLKSDKEVSDKLAEIERIQTEQASKNELEEKYNRLLSEAASRENGADYAWAISKYREASTLKPAEQLPKDKIAALEKQIANLGEQTKVEQEYRGYMNKGDELMNQQKYLEAIQEFNKALALKPGEQEPVDKALEAERLEKAKVSDADAQYEKILSVARKKIDEQDYQKATELLERAIGLKERDDRPKQMLAEVKELQKKDQDFKALMTQGDNLAASKKYADAKSKYEQAATLKPAAPEPPVKIAEMDKLLGEQSSVAEKEALYRSYMDKGNVAMGTKNYEQALNQFRDALSVKPGDIPANDKIREIQQILDDIANANARDLDAKNKFNALIREADGLFDGTQYLPAKTKYEDALKIDPSSSYARKRVDECVRLEKERTVADVEREYQKIITAGDKRFGTAEYEKAKEYYLRALTIKKDDPYPKRKLDEIEAILNPVTVSSAELEDLGDPYSRSLEEAMLELKKAEEARKALKTNSITSRQKDIHDAATDMNAEKTQRNYDTREQVYLYQQGVQQEFTEYDLGRLDNMEVLQAAQKALQDAQVSDMRMEQTANQSDQIVLNAITANVSVDNLQRDEVHMNNADLVNSYSTSLANELRQNARKDHEGNIDMDQNIADIHIKVDQDVRDDYAERALVERDVVLAQKLAKDEFTERSNERYGTQLSNQVMVAGIQEAVETKNEIDIQVPRENNSELVSIRKDIQDEAREQMSAQQAHNYKTDAGIAEVKRQVISDGQDLDANRLASNEVLKSSQKNLADAQYESYEGEFEKYVRNKAIIVEQVTQSEEIKKAEKDAHAVKVAYVNTMDKKATVDSQEALEGDEAERLEAKRRIENVYTNVQTNSNERKETLQDNAVSLNDINKTIRAEEYSAGMGQTEKHYSNQQALNSVDNTPQEKPKVANSLGEEYPEGVSEEQFTKSDQNGLMTTIITRRIVVIDGHADVYVRTQTLNGITYTKNGVSIVSHVWSKETQDPKLERHF